MWTWQRMACTTGVVLLLTLLLVYPLGKLAFSSPVYWSEVLTDSYYWQRLGITLAQGLLAALCCGLLGIPSAVFFWLVRFRMQNTLLQLFLLPFLIPTIVAALAILSVADAMSALSIFSEWLGANDEGSMLLLLWAYVFYNLGMVLFLILGALRRIPVTMVESARNLGAGLSQVFLYLLWPHIRSTVYASLLLCFLFCSSNFGLALLLGGAKYATLEVEIYTLALHELNLGAATVLASLQMLMTAIAIYLYSRFDKDPGLGLSLKPLRWRLSSAQRAWAYLCLGICSFLILAPLLTLFAQALAQPMGMLRMLGSEEFVQACLNTIWFACLALLGASLFSVAVVFSTYAPTRGSANTLANPRANPIWTDLLQYAPFLISASVLSLALLYTYPEWTGSLGLLLAGYALLAYPYISRQLNLALRQHQPQLLWAARNLGANPWQTFRHGLWPQIAATTRQGLALAAATMLGEFAVSLFLSRPEWMTLTTFIYDRFGRVGQDFTQQAYAAAAVLLLLAVLVFRLISGKNQID